MVERRDIVIGIAGCGLIGRQHAAELAALDCAPRYFYDRHSAASRTLAAEFGGISCASYDDLIAAPELTAVYICTYNDSHLPFASLAATSGKDIFIEKPLALTLATAREIQSAVVGSNVRCMTGFKFRYTDTFRKAREFLPTPRLLAATLFEPRWPDNSWANDPQKGGGNVLAQGCHIIDLLIAMASSEPKRVSAFARNMHHPALDIIDAIAGTLEFESGAIATFTIGDLGASPLTSKFHLSALDGKKSVQLHNRMKSLVFFDGHSATGFEETTESGFRNENIEFLAALREGRTPLTTAADGVLAAAVLETAIESSKQRRVMEIPALTGLSPLISA